MSVEDVPLGNLTLRWFVRVHSGGVYEGRVPVEGTCEDEILDLKSGGWGGIGTGSCHLSWVLVLLVGDPKNKTVSTGTGYGRNPPVKWGVPHRQVGEGPLSIPIRQIGVSRTHS